MELAAATRLQQQYDAYQLAALQAILPSAPPLELMYASPATMVATSTRQPGVDGWTEFTQPRAVAREQGAPAFGEFLRRLRGTPDHPAPAEYQRTKYRSAFIGRVDNLLDAMEASPVLRGGCFALADQYTTTCADNVTHGLNDMETRRISHDAETNNYPVAKLFGIAEDMFKRDAVDKIANEKIMDLRASGVAIDEIEIRLKYQTMLADRLQLPGVARGMLHSSCAGQVTDADIAAAERRINTQLERSESVNFIADWKPWQKAMLRNNPERYRAGNDYIHARSEALDNLRVRMSDDEFTHRWNQLRADKETMEHEVTVDLTREFLESLV